MGKKKDDQYLEREAWANWFETVMVDYELRPSDIAKWMGCSNSTVSKMQNRRESRIPSFGEICRFSMHSGISLDDIASEVYSFENGNAPGADPHRPAKDEGLLKRFSRLPLEGQETALALWEVVEHHKKTSGD